MPGPGTLPAVTLVYQNFAANLLINSFQVNQRAYVSAASLAAGIYGHDRWKAGAAGGDYSFTQLNAPTQATIAANKSLIQVVENNNVIGGNYVLSWTGTATARVGLNSATPSGNFAVSPIIITGQNPGTTMSVEFTGANAVGVSTIATNTGTINTPKLEAGVAATPYVEDDFATLLVKCQRYCQLLGGTTNDRWIGQCFSTSRAAVTIGFRRMRAVPTITAQAAANYSLADANRSLQTVTGVNLSTAGNDMFELTPTVGGTPLVAGNATELVDSATGGFLLTAEL